MAAAIPAAIGVGSSIIGGISGKGARKRQEQELERQRRMLQPLIDAQLRTVALGERELPGVFDRFRESYGRAGELGDIALTDYKKLLDDALGKSSELYGLGKESLGRSEGYLRGAATGLDDLQKFYRPFMEGPAAIDRFLPSKTQTENMLAPEFAQINEGYRAQIEGLDQAPRGGGRITAYNEANRGRQRDLSTTFFGGRQALGDRALGAAFQSAAGEGSRLSQLMQLGMGEGQLGLGKIGAGTSILGTGGGLAQNSFSQALQALQQRLQATGGMGALAEGLTGNANNLYSLFNQQANRTVAQQNQGTSGKGLGGFLVDLFSNKGVQDKLGGIFGGGKNKNLFLTEPYNPYGNQTKDFDFFA